MRTNNTFFKNREIIAGKKKIHWFTSPLEIDYRSSDSAQTVKLGRLKVGKCPLSG